MKSKKFSLDSMFYPESVIIFEAQPKISFFIEGFKRQGFNPDNLYLISSKIEKIQGIRCYNSIRNVPLESIDLLILSVKRELVVNSIKEILKEKEVRFIHIFTAGTAEFDDIGLEIEKEIKNVLNKYPNTRAIGPNCMGIYSPKGKIAYYSSFPPETGNIALIFQSGDLHSKMIKFGASRHDLRFSKGISIGNCVDIQFSEVLEYYNKDNEIDLICVYFEGFSTLYKKQGRVLFNTLKEMTKPVLFMRGGKTLRGQSTVLTHTGSLAGLKNIWKGIFRQTPIIEVPSSLDELIEYSYTFSKYINRFKLQKREISYPKSKRALVILWSGGFGILATDRLTELGIELPIFEGPALKKLKDIYPIKIGSLANPFDLPWIIHRKEFPDLVKTAIDDNIDFIIVETDAWSDMEGERFKSYYKNLYEIKEYVEYLGKVFSIILHQYPSNSRERFYEMLKKDNFLVYNSIEIAAKSFLKLYEYGQKINKLNNK